MRAGFFVTGTDTGVGKTVSACALVRGLRSRGVEVGVFKPIETGVGREGPLDAIALRQAAEVDDDLSDICPLQFSLPAAPNVAAEHEGRKVDLRALEQAYARIRARHEFVIVEGAGGLLVPLNDEFDMADLAREFELPLLLVTRTALGTINHTLLSIHEIESRTQALAGVILSHATGELSPADDANLSHLRRVLGSRIVGEVPHLRAGKAASADTIDIDRLLAAR